MPFTSNLKCLSICFCFVCFFNSNYKGVPCVNATAGILARTKLPYHSLVQDGEANVTRIRGRQKDLF